MEIGIDPPAQIRQGKAVAEHLARVAVLCEDRTTLPGWAGAILCQIALLHDLGMFKPEWQTYIDSGGKSPGHTAEGAAYLYDRLQNSAGLVGALIISANHTRLPDVPLFQGEIRKFQGIYRNALTVEAETFLEQAGLEQVEIPGNLTSRDGLLDLEFYIRLMFGILIDSDRRELSGIGKPASNRRYLIEFARQVGGTAIAGARGFYVMEGIDRRRVVAQFAAHHATANTMEGLIVVISDDTLASQVAESYRELFGADAVFLDCETTDDLDEETILANNTWEEPIVVTTATQFFQGCLFSNQPNGCRKIPAICDRVVVIDEVQSFPLKFLAPILQMLQRLVRLARCSVVLQSAILPDLNQWGIAPTPIVSPTFPQNNPTFEELSWDEIAIRMAPHPNGIAIANTEKGARQAYEVLRRKFGESAFYFSERLYLRHRQERLQEIAARLDAGRRVYIAATAAIHAGIGMKFAVGFREAAGIDSLVRFAEMVALPTVFGKFADTQQERGVREALHHSDKLLSQEAIATYFRVVLGDLSRQSEILDYQKRLEFRQIARKFRLQEPTAIVLVDEAKELIARLKSGASSYRQKQILLHQLHQYSAAIPPNTRTKYDPDIKLQLLPASQYRNDIGIF